MKELNRLTAAGAKSLGAGKHHDGSGLYLVKSRPERGKWVLRLTIFGRRREMGLGPFPEISLADARRQATEARYLVRQGRDPIGERQLTYRTTQHLLGDVAREAFEAKKAELKDDGKAGRWMSPLELHVLPKLGKTPVTKLNQMDIATVLKPLWHTKADTARKAINRLNIVINHAAAMGLDVDTQATTKARALLGKSRHKVENIPAMPWQEVPAFYASLNDGSVCHLALRLLILTGLRSKPIRFAHLDQFDGDVWTVPAENMKGRVSETEDFRVPLSPAAKDIVEQAAQNHRNGFIFPSQRKGVISDATMSRLMERRGLPYRPHGFRSSLRTWLAEETNAPFEVAEMMLAHKPMNKVQRAYQRSDYFEQRAALLKTWAGALLYV